MPLQTGRQLVNSQGGGALAVEVESDALEAFQSSHREQMELCDLLEKIADSLPQNLDRQTCIHVAKAIGPIISRGQEIEEAKLFKAVENAGEISIDPRVIVDRLRMDQLGTIFMSEEIFDVLISHGAGNPTHGAEATGYLLRGFFSGLRRHLALEQELLAPTLAKIVDQQSAKKKIS
jgi:hypothetical protein